VFDVRGFSPILGDFRVIFWCFGVTLAYFGVTLGSLWGHFGVSLGLL
jgi:hypothetical protein